MKNLKMVNKIFKIFQVLNIDSLQKTKGDIHSSQEDKDEDKRAFLMAETSSS